MIATRVDRCSGRQAMRGAELGARSDTLVIDINTP
jgi:hypothetical protein